MSATFHQQIKQNTLGCPDEGRLLFSNLMLMSCQPLGVISGRLNSAIRKYTFQNPLHNYMYTHCNQVKKKMIPAVNTHTDTASMTACTGVGKQLLVQHLHTRQWLNLRVSIQECSQTTAQQKSVPCYPGNRNATICPSLTWVWNGPRQETIQLQSTEAFAA